MNIGGPLSANPATCSVSNEGWLAADGREENVSSRVGPCGLVR